VEDISWGRNDGMRDSNAKKISAEKKEKNEKPGDEKKFFAR